MPMINSGRAKPGQNQDPTLWVDYAQTGGSCVIVPNTIEIADLEPYFGKLKEIYIEFPAFTDGRGFSIARQLRRAGFTGEIIASGPLIPDQYAYALQCGFSSVRIEDDLYQRHTPQAWEAILSDFDLIYQRGYVSAELKHANIIELRAQNRTKRLAA